MAHMTQEKKAIIAAELKKVMPKDWRYTLRVLHSSTLEMTIRSAPVDLLAALKTDQFGTYGEREADKIKQRGHYVFNDRRPDADFTGELLILFKNISHAMHTGNWDRSDMMTDYFDVGHYVRINIGQWGAPFKFTPATETLAEAA